MDIRIVAVINTIFALMTIIGSYRRAPGAKETEMEIMGLILGVTFAMFQLFFLDLPSIALAFTLAALPFAFPRVRENW